MGDAEDRLAIPDPRSDWPSLPSPSCLAILATLALFLCCNSVLPFSRWPLLLGYRHTPLKTVRQISEYMEMSLPPGTRLIDGEIVDTLQHGSGILARVSVPKAEFPQFAHDPRFAGILKRGDAAVLEYSRPLWPRTVKAWGLPFKGRGVVGGRKFSETGFIAREEADSYTVHLWEYH